MMADPLARPARPGRLVLLGGAVEGRSLSPRFQNAALRAAGIPLVYEAVNVDAASLEAMLETLRAENGAGNVTIPHKEAVAARCARLTPLASRCGAVNVFWHEDGDLVGDNTDVGGADMVAQALLRGATAGATVAVIGAGGAAAGVLAAVEGWGGATARVYNRHMPRARQLADRFAPFATVAATIEEAVRGATLVVNATPAGTRDDDPFPVPLEMLPARAAVFDLVIHPSETAWVRAARDAGHWSADGRGMLVEQGALAFERWFGRPPDRNAMWAAMP
ncbi:MAG: Shikimate dehydrogenase [Gemmatimonadetes bacterium]|nr:Shikimate dehydrogenase [Gemmatimonadota bacterium]